MSQPKWLDKYLVMKPEVNKIFDDLEAWHDHCRFEMINFDPADLYKSKAYKDYVYHKNGKRNGYRQHNGDRQHNGERQHYGDRKPFRRNNY